MKLVSERASMWRKGDEIQMYVQRDSICSGEVLLVGTGVDGQGGAGAGEIF